LQQQSDWMERKQAEQLAHPTGRTPGNPQY
jgi:hypothetical protein